MLNQDVAGVGKIRHQGGATLYVNGQLGILQEGAGGEEVEKGRKRRRGEEEERRR